jgi:flagellar motor switch protein FliN
MSQTPFNDLTGPSSDPSADWAAGLVAPAQKDADMSMVMDLPVHVQVELGRAKLSFRELAQIEDGTVVELDTDAGRPVDLMVNGCLVARGEIVIVNDRYGLRVTDIISTSERYTRRRH